MLSFANITAANTTLDIIDAINIDWTGGILGILLLITLAVVVFINIGFYGSKEAFLFTSFFVSIMAGMLWLTGMVAMYVFVVAVVVLFVAVLLTILMGDR